MIFDFGGVIITPITRQIGMIAEGLGCSTADLHHVMMGPQFESGDHPWHRLERGEIGMEVLQELLEPIAAAAGMNFRGDEVEKILAPGMYEVNHFVLEKIGELRGRGYKTALLSNSIREFRPKLEEDVPPRLFDAYIDSSHVGMRKPEPEIFHRTLRELALDDPSHAIFLDDFAGNLAGAQAVGLRTIHVKNPHDALEELEVLLGG
ncbi:MAG: HAD family phosphatase [Actinobacteria bacterium]|nr:HAD family phosphatase [Actinomycetota bacterium]NBP54067.1 HAD family phosphatase [Actinomycetota bacterium]